MCRLAGREQHRSVPEPRRSGRAVPEERHPIDCGHCVLPGRGPLLCRCLGHRHVLFWLPEMPQRAPRSAPPPLPPLSSLYELSCFPAFHSAYFCKCSCSLLARASHKHLTIATNDRMCRQHSIGCDVNQSSSYRTSVTVLLNRHPGHHYTAAWRCCLPYLSQTAMSCLFKGSKSCLDLLHLSESFTANLYGQVRLD